MNKKQTTILLLLSIIATIGRSQVQVKEHKIYGDTSLVEVLTFQISSNNHPSFKDFKGHFNVNFLDISIDSLKMADGIWYYYNTTDSTTKNLNNKHLLIKGEFKDSLRNGKFEYYYIDPFGDVTQELIIYYKNGQKHGRVIFRRYKKFHYNGKRIKKWKPKKLVELLEGNFYEGKKHGFFIQYGETQQGTLHPDYIAFYQHGKLISWIVYKQTVGIDNYIYTTNEIYKMKMTYNKPLNEDDLVDWILASYYAADKKREEHKNIRHNKVTK